MPQGQQKPSCKRISKYLGTHGHWAQSESLQMPHTDLDRFRGSEHSAYEKYGAFKLKKKRRKSGSNPDPQY